MEEALKKKKRKRAGHLNVTYYEREAKERRRRCRVLCTFFYL